MLFVGMIGLLHFFLSFYALSFSFACLHKTHFTFIELQLHLERTIWITSEEMRPLGCLCCAAARLVPQRLWLSTTETDALLMNFKSPLIEQRALWNANEILERRFLLQGRKYICIMTGAVVKYWLKCQRGMWNFQFVCVMTNQSKSLEEP